MEVMPRESRAKSRERCQDGDRELHSSRKRRRRDEEDDDKEASRPRHRPREPSPPPRRPAAAPNLQASGLLAGEDHAAGPASSRAPRDERAEFEAFRQKIRQRSRSRDEPPARRESAGPRDRTAASERPSGAPSKGGGKGAARGDGGPGGGGEGGAPDAAPIEEPNFEASGLLAVEDNSKNGIALKFTMPPEARPPGAMWRLYIFQKRTEAPKIIHIHRLMGYLFGKDRRVVDIPTDHATCSKQHAVLHYRLAGTGEVRPYVMDLESVNGTFLNGERIEPARYYEIRERDVLKFGMSTREYVLLHAGSANGMAIDPARLLTPE